ncbi:MAG TPA: 16S rRNA (guanine(527)-N(7))-methyltransferase RsmG [Clostridiales bacterium]|nr:16S rRNA (guanine(527)-N(7))-methyltransferase RsmG [Clostridiales bacterium]
MTIENKINKRDFIKDAFKGIDIKLTELQIDQFIQYYEMLIIWNKVVNLTTIVEFEDVVLKHFVDSIYLSKLIILEDQNIIDVGTGAGFPGIPLKIVYPNLKIVLLDSLNKRIKFLKLLVDKLGLNNVECIHSRAEDLGHNLQYRELFDISISRAVAKLSILSEYCLPFVKKDGIFISYKSMNIEIELEESKSAIKKLSGKVKTVNKYLLPDTDINRSIVIIEKKAKMNKNFPRTAGKPSKEPL